MAWYLYICVHIGWYTHKCFLTLAAERAYKQWHPNSIEHSPIQGIRALGETACFRTGVGNIQDEHGAYWWEYAKGTYDPTKKSLPVAEAGTIWATK